MLDPEDLTLPLEKELRLRVIKEEVENCNDVKALKENLTNCAESLMRFQHLTARLVEKQLKNDMELFFSTMGIETAEK